MPAAILLALALLGSPRDDPADRLGTRVDALARTLADLHQPFLPEVALRLSRARALPEADPVARARAIERAVDLACIAEVDLAAKGSLATRLGAASPSLPRHAWRTFPIKVRNPKRLTGVLEIGSRDAAPEAGFDRWLGLAGEDGDVGPIEIEVESDQIQYAIVRLSSRAAGAFRARLAVEFLPDVPDLRGPAAPPVVGSLAVPLLVGPPARTAPDVAPDPFALTLADAIDQANRLDPGWTLEEIEQGRVVPPPGRNGGDRVREIVAKLPKDWDGAPPGPASANLPRLETSAGYGEALSGAMKAPDRRLPADLAAAVRLRLDRVGPALLASAREIEGYRGGRFPLRYDRVIFNTKLPDTQGCRQVVRLLYQDAIERADRGDVDGALASARAIIRVGKALADEPFLISQLVRIAVDMVAAEAIERSLAQGEASEVALAQTQALVAGEADAPVTLIGMRGERAGFFDLLEKLATGEIDIKELSGEVPKVPPAGGREIPMFRANQALSLALMTRAVEICKRPISEQGPLLAAFERDTKPPEQVFRKTWYATTYLLLPAISAGMRAHPRSTAILRTTEYALAVERARLRLGRWPEPGESLAAGPPIDPYDDRPLRRVADGRGLALYSVGFDKVDDAGKLNNRESVKQGSDYGVRLFDPADRRRPAAQ